jgi:hypothetical protein
VKGKHAFDKKNRPPVASNPGAALESVFRKALLDVQSPRIKSENTAGLAALLSL